MKYRSIFTLALCLSAFASVSQTLSSFDNLPLPGPDTFYQNFTAPGQDVGFQDGLAYFPCVYDTGFGYTFWSSGFAYSSKRDSTTSGFGNQYAAKPYAGQSGTTKYAVAYGEKTIIRLKGAAIHRPVQGFWIANTTYAFNSMRDGDFFAKRFGGPTGNDPDYFRAIIRGFRNGNRTTDSVVAYLADFRGTSATDSISNSWQYVNTLSLGGIDSLEVSLQSSDNGAFGMNTPAYYAIDNLRASDGLSVAEASSAPLTVYPNPAVNTLSVVLPAGSEHARIYVTDISGKLILSAPATASIDIRTFATGRYILRLTQGEQVIAKATFLKAAR